MRALTVVMLFVSRLASAAPLDDDDRSEATGTYLSLAGTVVPAAMFAGAVYAARRSEGGPEGSLLLAGTLSLAFLPSAGAWYAGETITPGMGIRAVGLGVALLGMVAYGESEGDESTTFWTGIAIMGAGAVLDLVETREAVHDWNRKHHVAISPSIARIDGSALCFGGADGRARPAVEHGYSIGARVRF